MRAGNDAVVVVASSVVVLVAVVEVESSEVPVPVVVVVVITGSPALEQAAMRRTMTRSLDRIKRKLPKARFYAWAAMGLRSDVRVVHELPYLLCTPARFGDLGSPLQGLVA